MFPSDWPSGYFWSKCRREHLPWLYSPKNKSSTETTYSHGLPTWPNYWGQRRSLLSPTCSDQIWSEFARSDQIWSEFLNYISQPLPAIWLRLFLIRTDQNCSEMPELISSVRSKSNQIPSRIWSECNPSPNWVTNTNIFYLYYQSIYLKLIRGYIKY